MTVTASAATTASQPTTGWRTVVVRIGEQQDAGHPEPCEPSGDDECLQDRQSGREQCGSRAQGRDPLHAVSVAPRRSSSPDHTPWRPRSGTNRTASSVSVASPSAVRVTRTNCSTPRPTGITRRPPGANCSSSGGGTAGAAAVTLIASYGAPGRWPSEPSPVMTSTCDRCASRARAADASGATTSTEVTWSASSASTAAP